MQDIIKKDNDKSQELQKYDSVMGANRTEINAKINDFTELQNQIDEKNNQIADIGNKAGIAIEIEKIQNEIETIKKSIDGYLTDEEDKKYKRFKDQVVKSEQKIRLLKSDIDQLNIAMDTELFVSIDTLISTFSVDSKEEITSFYEAFKTETKDLSTLAFWFWSDTYKPEVETLPTGTDDYGIYVDIDIKPFLFILSLLIMY